MPLAEQSAALRRHAGAARFAYNHELARVKELLEARKQNPAIKVPWSGFDLINHFNQWKLSAEAGVGPDGKPGLGWRGEVLQQVFEEAAVDLGKGLKHWREGRGKARRTGFPRFRKRGEHDAFRVRNQKDSVRVEGDAVRLPKIGCIRVRESTRRLLRMLRMLRPRSDGHAAARVLFATVTFRQGRWVVRLNLEANSFHPQMRAHKSVRLTAGIDRGLHAFAVAASAAGEELWRNVAPKPLGANLRRLRRLGRRLSFKKKHSRNRSVARRRLGRLHHRISNIRRAHVHALTSHIALSSQAARPCVARRPAHLRHAAQPQPGPPYRGQLLGAVCAADALQRPLVRLPGVHGEPVRTYQQDLLPMRLGRCQHALAGAHLRVRGLRLAS